MSSDITINAIDQFKYMRSMMMQKQSLPYGACGGNPIISGLYAFGGRKFDLPMKDGTFTHCYVNIGMEAMVKLRKF